MGHRSAIEWTDPEGFRRDLAHALPIHALGAIGAKSMFRSRCVRAGAGDAVIVSAAHTPLYAGVSESDRVTLLITLEGEADVWMDHRHLEAKGRLSVLFLPGPMYAVQSGHFSSVVVTVSPSRILQAGAAMAGLEEPDPAMQAALARPLAVRGDQIRADQSVQGLRHVLDLLGLLSRFPEGLVASVGLEDVLYRCIAMVLMPCLRGEERLHSGVGARHCRVEDIEDFLMANLEGRLALTDLECRFRLSRRTLQHVFRVKHGCGPIQWQRRQRLRYARNLLLDRGHGCLRVSDVASRCGYTDLSGFSRDFKEIFRARPSDYLGY